MSPDADDVRMRQAEASERLRERFSVPEVLNTVCHDVRATLSVTAGSATELGSPEYGPLNDVQQQLVAIIQRGNLRLARLAGNLAQLSELWEGSLELRPSRADLAALVRQTLDELRRQDPQSKIVCEVSLPDQPLTAQLDIERTRQVLVNILGIALSVAHGRVTVSLAASNGAAVLRVEDDGPERRRTVPREGIKRVSSTELALAVSEGLLFAQGGTLTLESPTSGPGGCRVNVTLAI